MSNKFEETVGGEANSVTAAHEAGHALVAWLSPAIESVTGTTWVRAEDGGESRVVVGTLYRKPATTFTIWEMLAIKAAGIAAELVTHMRFKTRPARVDLDGLRHGAEGLRKTCPGRMPISPWQAPTATIAPPFERYFEGGLAPDTSAIVRLTYLRARERILSHRRSYERLRMAMIVKIELTTDEIAAAIDMPKA